MTDAFPFRQAVLRRVRRIPYGKVLSYGDVAALVGQPRAARGVGHVLSTLGERTDVPWWRVVNARGEISLPGYPGQLQRMLLEQEGVRFRRGGGIDLKVYRWVRARAGAPRGGEDGR